MDILICLLVGLNVWLIWVVVSLKREIEILIEVLLTLNKDKSNGKKS